MDAFNQVLEMAESLSDLDQDYLIEILQKRLGEKRRKEIAASITEAHAEYRLGAASRVTVKELMTEGKNENS